MSRERLGGPAWLCCAAVLLTVGFLGWVYLGTTIALAHAKPDTVLKVMAAFSVYARVVLLKGLLPALLLALLLWWLLDRGGRFSHRGRFGLALGLAIAAALASVAVAAALLPLRLPGLPSVTFTGPLNFARTCAELAGAVMLGAWIPRSVSKRAAVWITSGVAVVFVAGWVSIVSWSQLRAPQQSRLAALGPNPSVANEPALAPPQTAPAVPPAASEPRRLEPDREAERPDPEEIERRHAAAARIRKLIEAGPNAVDPPIGGGVLAEGDPHPVYENGELRGVELQNLRPDGLYARLGLRDGDLVQSINGVGLAESGELVQAIAGSPTIVLSVEHVDGTQDRISLPREQILEQLKILE